MIAPLGSNGEAGPTSMRKPVSLPVVFHVIVVPTFTQNAALLLALGMLEVVDAPSEVRFTSTVQGEEADPHVFAAVQSCSGLGSEQAYLLLRDWAAATVTNRGSNNISDLKPFPRHLRAFTRHPRGTLSSCSDMASFTPRAHIVNGFAGRTTVSRDSLRRKETMHSEN
jgi:hypothetical protein